MAARFPQIPARDMEAVKRASFALAAKAGGIAQAAASVGIAASRLSEACSIHHSDRWLNLLNIAELEVVADDPVVTRALASISGFDLVPQQAGPHMDLHQQLALLSRQAGGLTAGLAEALGDGKIDAKESKALLSASNNLITELHGFAAQLGAAML